MTLCFGNKKKHLINGWILNELTILQKEYFILFEKKEINLIINKLIKFTREKLSNEYLELAKVSSWDINTRSILLFVYQQLLVMFHPVIPFLTEYIYQEITQEKILSTKIEILEGKKNSELWQIDCLILLLKNVRNLRSRNTQGEFFLELTPEWEKKYNDFDFNYFLTPLTKSQIFVKKRPTNEKISLVDLLPFGVLWYKKKNLTRGDWEKKIEFYQKEIERSQNLLKNDKFIQRAPDWLVEKEKKKIDYYKEQKEKLVTEWEKS